MKRILVFSGCLFLAGCAEPAKEPGTASTLPPQVQPESQAEEVFVDVTREAGIEFVHFHGGTGERYMMETVGSGAGFFDYDNDGDIDIYLVQSGPLPGLSDDQTFGNQLYRNNGDGTFTDVTMEAGVGDRSYGMGCAFGDYDNDGWVDIFVTNFGPNRLYHNEGNGRFTDRTAAANLGDPGWGTSAAFADYDGDGDLDLYLVNYGEMTMENNVRCGPADFSQYCGPQAYEGTPDILYRNEGNGIFRDVTAEAGMTQQTAYLIGTGLGVVWTDYDDDGDPDLYVANDQAANFLYRNRGDGTFEDVSILSGAAYNEEGVAEAGMGLDAGDFDNDGDFDLFLTHLSFETNTLYRNTGQGTFEDQTYGAKLGTPSVLYLGFGTNFFDYDNDGHLDIFIANGHVMDNVHLTKPVLSYEEKDQLFRNLGNGDFEDRSALSGAYFRTARVGRGAAFGDYDGDGDVDILVTNSNQPAVLLRNEVGTRNHWVALDLRGVKGNRDAIGARVKVKAGDLILIEEVRSATSYLSQNDLRLFFGLGDRDRVDEVEIRWPNGFVQILPGEKITVDGFNRILEPRESPSLALWRKN